MGVGQGAGAGRTALDRAGNREACVGVSGAGAGDGEADAEWVAPGSGGQRCSGSATGMTAAAVERCREPSERRAAERRQELGGG
jgi:hypothetical protein